MKNEINPRYAKINENVNIIHTKGRYIVQKAFNYKNIQFGSFKTIEEAKEIRDLLVSNNWEKNNEYLIAKYNTPTYRDKYIHNTKKGHEVVKKIDGVSHNYGIFQNIEDARKRRTECLLKDWKVEE